MAKLKSIRAGYNNTDDGQAEMIQAADTGIYKLTLNFMTEEAFEDFVNKTGLVELYKKRQLHYHKPERGIDAFF